MDSFAEQDDDDDENILQKPMHAYNTGAENIQLPELLLNDNSDASECEDELEPLIYHPVLDKQTISNTAVPDQLLPRNPVLDDAPKQTPLVQTIVNRATIPRASPVLDVDLSKITLSDADLAEMELDNAILSIVPSNPLDGKVEHDFSSLSDSSSSGSSLLGKLEETMAKLKKEEEHYSNISDNVKKNMTMINQLPGEVVSVESGLDVERETVKVDLRLSQQVPTNRCVYERYGRKPNVGDDEDEDTEDVRLNIKQESQRILLNKGKRITENMEDSAIKAECLDEEEFVSQEEVVSLSDSVDSMLENVNRIMSKGVQGALSEEVQINGLVNNQSINSFSLLDVAPCTEEPMEWETAEMTPSGSSQGSINLEMNTKVVNWNDYSKLKEHTTLPAMTQELKEEERQCDIREEISDSIFTNVFFSTATKTTSSLTHQRPVTITYSRPRKNILTVSDKLFGKADKHKPKVQEPVLGDEDPLNDEKDPRENNEISCEVVAEMIVECNDRVSEDEELKEETKKNIKNCLQENADIEKVLPAEKLNRKLKYSDEKTIETVINNKIKDAVKERECLACHLNNPMIETPMKHDESVCVNNNPVLESKIKSSQKVKNAATTVLNSRDHNQFLPENHLENGPLSKTSHVEPLVNGVGSNKENLIEEPGMSVEDSPVTEAVPTIVASKNPKNRKKKKSKKKNGQTQEKNGDGVAEVLADMNTPTPTPPKKVEGISEALLNELSQGGKEKVLYDETSSFEESSAILPDSCKEVLLLKVPLESPGVCKSSTKDIVSAEVDESRSDNYIGLITLFIYLLQGSRRDVSLPNLGIPFDVVALQQAYLDSELLLIVGIVENKNTYSQKVKRSKLGTAFFHAVSLFLNSHDLEKIILKIWEHTEADFATRLVNNAAFSHIWRQVEQSGEMLHPCSIPGRGKLSNLINISPDANASQRILKLSPSLFVHREVKGVVGDEFDWFRPSDVQQEYTCITVENVTAISPKHVSELLKRLRKESVEICGLRILYNNKDNCLYTPHLSICINEMNAATATEGKLLLSDCEELKELAISFNMQANISVIMNGSPLLKYTINAQRSHRQVVQAFGPQYTNADHIKSTIEEMKSSCKISTNKNDKKKWTVGTCRDLYLLNNHVSASVLCIDEIVPSAFISFVISMALKKGLQLKMVYRTSCPLEEKMDGAGHSESDKRRSHTGVTSCILMLFSGKSVVFRLLGLVDKFTYILNNPLTGETILPWMADNMIKFTRSHNTTNENVKLNYNSKDFFRVFHFNDPMKDVLSKAFRPMRRGAVEDLYPVLSRVCIEQMKPEMNLMAVVFYGDEVLNDIPTILCAVMSGSTYQCISSWRKAVKPSWLCSPVFPFDSVKHQPTIELLGTKYITELTELDASNFVACDYHSATWDNDVSKMVGSRAAVVILKVIDTRTATEVADNIWKSVLSLKTDLSKSNYIIHTGSEHVFRLMFHYFDLNEIHGDQIKDETQTPTYCIPDNHDLFTRFDGIETGLDCQLLVKKKLPNKEWRKLLPRSSLPRTTVVYEFTPKSLNFPLHMLLSGEESYTTICFAYHPHNLCTIFKALVRITRMDFRVAALKFPFYDVATGACYVCAVLSRHDAVFVLNKMLPELEMNFNKLKINIASTVHDVAENINEQFKGSSKMGGIFYCNYFALLHELHFENEESFDHRENREVEWKSPLHNGSWLNKGVCIPGSIVSANEEISVVILTEPLLCGTYLGKKLPDKTVVPAILQYLEQALYQIIAVKMTMLSEEGAREVVEIYGIEGKQKLITERLLSQDRGPFVAVALIGSTVIANFWTFMNRILDDEDAFNALKRHALVPTSKKQVQSLLACLFDKVVLNTKVDLKTRLK